MEAAEAKPPKCTWEGGGKNKRMMCSYSHPVTYLCLKDEVNIK